jgi:glucokinase
MTGEGLVGVDLGGTGIKAVFIRPGGLAVDRSHVIDTPRAGDPKLVVDSLVEAARAVMDTDRALAVGVGVPGQFDAVTGCLRSLPNVPGEWEGFPLREAMRQRLQTRVHLVNDSQAFTLAETLVGAAVGKRVVLGMTLGTGIGGGICIDGRLHRGANGSAGEIGHQVVVTDGPRCGCGRHGCLEAVARSAAFAELAGTPTAADAFEAVRRGEPRAVAALETVTGYLGIGLANLTAVVDPDVIVVGGGQVQAGDLLLEPLRAATRASVSMVPPESVTIVAGALGTLAGAIGAALA